MPQGYDGLPSYYTRSSDPITPNLGLSLKGMDPIIAEDFVLIDTAFASVGGSGFPTRFITVTSAYVAVAGDFVLCNTTAGGFTVTLPLSGANVKSNICVKKISSDQNVLTIAASGSDSIDAQSSWVTTQQNTSMLVTADGTTNWFIY